MATILKGAPVVAAMNERNALLCEQLKAKGITPTLAVVRVGEREDDLSYERGVIAAARWASQSSSSCCPPTPRRSSCFGYWTR